MKKLVKAMALAILGIALGWGLIAGLADEKAGKSNRPVGQGCNVKNPREGNGGFDAVRNNPKIQEEMKRHKKAMRELKEDVATLRKIIRDAVKVKWDELRAQKDNSQGQGKTKPLDNNQDILKNIVEAYRPQAEALAARISAEVLFHQQSIANILATEQASINKRLTERILMPGNPGQGNWKKGQENKGGAGKHEEHGKSESPK